MGYHETGQAPRLLDLVQGLVTLLQDYEAEVRTSAVENIARMAQLIASQDIFHTHLSPLLQTLASDSVMEVRSNLALSIMDCCDPTVCNVLSDSFIKSDFKGVIEALLNEDYSEVQLRILRKLSSITHLFTKSDKIVVSTLNMAKSSNWRVRESVAKLLPHFADSLGVQYFETQLLRDYWLPLLLDPVSDVRSACVSGMPKLFSVTGDSWMQVTLVPQLIRIYDESVSYLIRITIVKCLESIASTSADMNNRSKMTTPSLSDSIVDHLLTALNDKIPNVRTSAIKSLSNLAEMCDRSTVQNKIRPALFIRARDDQDFDCRFFAQSGMDRFV
jgi:HEAT repeat protein